MKKDMRGIGFYVAVLLILIAVLTFLYTSTPQEKMTYSQFVNLFETQQVTKFTIDGKNNVVYELKDGTTGSYRLPNLDIFYYDLGDTVKAQRKAGQVIQDFDPPAETPWFVSMMPYILMVVVFVLLWVYLLNQSGGGAGGKVMSFGKSKAKILTENQKKTNFGDVAGADEEKEELEEVVEFLKSPKKFIELGARIPKGILMVGPPGTGKTLLARAVAGEAGVPFFSISGSDFVEMFVGVGASRVRDLFEQAKKSAPCIIFIDEIDAVGRQRGAGLGGGHDEREQTLNQLLVEMDGFGVNEGVIVIAATNRPDILDSALLRPGRFDRRVYVNVPDVKGREEILKVHSKGKPLGSDVNLGTIAKTTSGFTGADLENVLNEAALLAARRGQKVITMKEIEEATIKVVVGPEKKSKVISEKEKKLTAYHEAGHAIVTKMMPGLDPVHEISIIPRGSAGGYTLSLPKEDKYYLSKNEMLDIIASLLGGRVAEKLTLDDISTGASNDIERATNIARKMVTKYGMSDTLGPITFGQANDEVFLGRDFATARNFSESIASQIDIEIKKIFDNAYERCRVILEDNMPKLHALAHALYEYEKLDGHAFERIMNGQEPFLEGQEPAKPMRDVRGEKIGNDNDENKENPQNNGDENKSESNENTDKKSDGKSNDGTKPVVLTPEDPDIKNSPLDDHKP